VNGTVIGDHAVLSQFSLVDDDLIFVNPVAAPQQQAANPARTPANAPNYDPRQVAQLSSQLQSIFSQGQQPAAAPAPTPVSGPITPQLFTQMLANVANNPQPVAAQPSYNTDEPGPEQVWEHFRTNPEALEQLLIVRISSSCNPDNLPCVSNMKKSC
jgi:hypothetical protein